MSGKRLYKEESIDNVCRNKKEMRGRIKISNKEEAETIIKGIENLVKKGQKLTDNQKYDYKFAKILLIEIKKRKKK
jgi:hypothetical protein